MIQTVTDWFSAMPVLAQVFWTCALLGSLIFLVQLVLTLLGMDASDVEVDFDGSDTLDNGGGMSLFSVRAFVNFLVGFGWTGVSFFHTVGNPVLLVLISFAVGVFFAWIVLLLWNCIKGLEQNRSLSVSECVGKNASVYLRIPAARQGKGKVQISIRGSVHELEAMTDGEMIPTGRQVEVVELINESILLVKAL